jgi:hypothetical protein
MDHMDLNAVVSAASVIVSIVAMTPPRDSHGTELKLDEDEQTVTYGHVSSSWGLDPTFNYERA